jgi:SAM-dependent methyltransferase
MAKSIFSRFEYFLRDLRGKEIFDAMRAYCKGDLLDVGGWDFYLTAKEKGIACSSWTTLEYDETHALHINDDKYRLVYGDGCAMDFEDETFDTILNIQVLEHVFEPIKMVQEIARVLKKGGHAIFVIPQTSVIHSEPHHYQNFSAFWIREVMARNALEIVCHKPLGGVWSSMASHLFFLVYYTLLRRWKSPTGEPRNTMFYLLYPFMVLYAMLTLPVCMFFSLGDLREEPNNHLVVVRKVKS